MKNGVKTILRHYTIIPFLVLIPLIIFAFSGKIAYDESTTYYNVLNRTPAELIAYEGYNSANHHLLNSLYYYVLQQLGIINLFIYRLPSFLLFFVYAVLLNKFLRSRKDYRLNYIDLAALYLWPYTIYFAQARGYALALVAFAVAFWYLKQYLRSSNPKHLFYIVFAGIISTLSIFSFLFPVIAVLAVVVVYRFREVMTSPARLLVLAMYIPVLYYVYQKGQIITEFDLNIIGGDSLFLGGTLSSMVSFMSLINFLPHHYFLILKLLYFATLVPALFIMVKRKEWHIEVLVILVTLLLLVLAHTLAGAMYPLFRGAAYILFLFYLALAYTNFKRHIFITIHMATICMIGVLYFCVIFWIHSHKDCGDVLTDISKSPGVLLDADMNRCSDTYNDMYHNNSINIIHCNMDDTACVLDKIDSARYVICTDKIYEAANMKESFIKMYKVTTFFDYRHTFYMRKENE